MVYIPANAVFEFLADGVEQRFGFVVLVVDCEYHGRGVVVAVYPCEFVVSSFDDLFESFPPLAFGPCVS